MRKLLFLLFLGLGLAAAHAQAPAGFVLRGRVLDAETRQAIPNAQVGVGDNRIGTSTNDEGRFVLAVPAAYAESTLEIALLGYQRYRRPLAGLAAGAELAVALRLSPAVLGEVAVSGSVTGIIREALARIPRNYPTRPTRLSGFLREADAGPDGPPLFVAEGTEQVLVPPYTQPKARGQVRLEQSRKVDLRAQAAGFGALNWSAGPFVPLRFDFVRNRAEFIQPARFPHYTYRVADLTSFHGEQVYVIAFAPRAGHGRAHYAGKLYIGVDSYAFLGADATRLDGGGANLAEGDDRDQPADSAAAPRFGGFTRSWQTRYQPYGGRWQLKEVHYRVRVGRRAAQHLADYLTTAIDTAGTWPYGYVERAQYEDVFLQNKVAYDSAFWRGYVPPLAGAGVAQALAAQAAAGPGLPATGPSAAAFGQAQAAAPPSRWQRRAEALGKRLSVSYGGGTLTVAADPGAVALDFAPAGSGFAAAGSSSVAAGRSTSFYTSSGYQLEVLPGLLVRYADLDVRGNYGSGQAGWQAGLGYQYNLSRRRRPVYLRAGLDYTRLVLGRDLGTYDNPDRGLRLAGTALKNDRLALALQTRTEALQPRLGLAVEFRHRCDFFVDAGYLLPLRPARTELSLRETTGFALSRSEAAQALPAANATLRRNDAPATAAPWAPGRLLWQAGVVLRLL